MVILAMKKTGLGRLGHLTKAIYLENEGVVLVQGVVDSGMASLS